MKVEIKINPKSGLPFWQFVPATDKEKSLCLNKNIFRVKGSDEAYYTYSKEVADCLAAGMEYKESASLESKTSEELRPLAAAKAKLAGLPTTDLRQVWKKSQLIDYLKNDVFFKLPETVPETVEEIPSWAQPEVTQDVPASNDLAAILANAMQPFISAPSMNPDAIRAMIKEELGNATNRFTVVRPDMPNVDAGIQHNQFPTVCKLIAARQHAMIVGGAGGGKTHCIHAAAEAMGLKYYCISVGQQTTKTDLIGFVSALGSYQTTQLRQAVEFGGVFLLDEADAGNANTLTILNAILANGVAAFPDAVVKVHEDFVCFCAMNTYGRGVSREYVGRVQLDGATIDRFAVIAFDYDNELEKQLAGNDSWAEKVQTWRERAFDLKERIIISPRASINGAKLLRAGFNELEVEDMVVWKGIDKAIVNKIKG